MGDSQLKKLVIIGASGHGKVIADIALNNQYDEIVFLDDDKRVTECAGFAVKGTTENIEEYLSWDFIVAIGDALARQNVLKKLENIQCNIVSLIHPKAVVSRKVEIKMGTVVMAGAVINSDTKIGKGCIVNTGASVDHDGIIDDFVHISVGAHVAGNVHIGLKTWIGAGAIVLNNLSICDNCIVGAGAVVIKDLEEEGTYIGVPAKRLIKE